MSTKERGRDNLSDKSEVSKDYEVPPNFIKRIIEEDVRNNKNGGKVVTRFPPEPNGYLHIGHAKSVCLNFGLAEEFGGKCNLRFDDTNPTKEEEEFVESIKEDVRWLGYDWDDREYYASDYFEKLYGFAVELIKKGKAYVCDLPPEKIKAYRGTLAKPGIPSPYRNRSAEENLRLFEKMKNGEFKDGEKVLRAKIDMTSGNMNMRDPVIYRIMHVPHHRTGNRWCIYPMYDFAHPLSDAIEGITHSICTLEFEDHRPLYEWFVSNVGVKAKPRQIEFARLNLSHTVLSKRRLLELVEGGYVAGWDDPRMPTIAGLRRRGCPPGAIKKFCESIGVAKKDSLVDIAQLEHFIREELNKTAPRRMAVLRPLKVIITNYPEQEEEFVEAVNNPEDPSMGTRKVPFSKILYIEQEDFKQQPPGKYYRLAPGREVRLRYAYFIRCIDYKKNSETGQIEELYCTYDPATRGGNAPDGRKSKVTLHWVSAKHAFKAEVRLYDRLFTVPDPTAWEDKKDFKEFLNPNSLEVIENCYMEPSLAKAGKGERFQFERIGYFFVDPVDSKEGKPIFNRIVTLKDRWARLEKLLFERGKFGGGKGK